MKKIKDHFDPVIKILNTLNELTEKFNSQSTELSQVENAISISRKEQISPTYFPVLNSKKHKELVKKRDECKKNIAKSRDEIALAEHHAQSKSSGLDKAIDQKAAKDNLASSKLTDKIHSAEQQLSRLDNYVQFNKQYMEGLALFRQLESGQASLSEVASQIQQFQARLTEQEQALSKQTTLAQGKASQLAHNHARQAEVAKSIGLHDQVIMRRGWNFLGRALDYAHNAYARHEQRALNKSKALLVEQSQKVNSSLQALQEKVGELRQAVAVLKKVEQQLQEDNHKTRVAMQKIKTTVETDPSPGPRSASSHLLPRQHSGGTLNSSSSQDPSNPQSGSPEQGQAEEVRPQQPGRHSTP